MSSPAEVLAAVGEALRAAKDQLNEADSAAQLSKSKVWYWSFTARAMP